MYLDISATEKALVDIQKVMTLKSQTRGDFCWRAGVYMDNLLQDAKANEQNLGEPFLGVRSRMAAGLYFDGFGRLTELLTRDPTFNAFETKVILASPISAPLSSLDSSPFLSSDDLSTPPTSHLPPPAFSTEKQMFADYWTESQPMQNVYGPKLDMEWLADSFLTGEGGVAPGDLSNYVAPGLLMVQ